MRPLHAPEPADLESWQSTWLWSCWRTLCVCHWELLFLPPCRTCRYSKPPPPPISLSLSLSFLVQYKWVPPPFPPGLLPSSSATTALCGASRQSANGYSSLVCLYVCRSVVPGPCQGLVVAQGVCCLLGPTPEDRAPPRLASPAAGPRLSSLNC